MLQPGTGLILIYGTFISLPILYIYISHWFPNSLKTNPFLSLKAGSSELPVERGFEAKVDDSDHRWKQKWVLDYVIRDDFGGFGMIWDDFGGFWRI